MPNGDGRPYCDGKVCYADPAHAFRAANRRMTSRREPPTYLRPYKCPKCGCYHLTGRRRTENP